MEPEEPEECTNKGRKRSLEAREEFFIVLCRLRRRFAEKHLAHLFHISQLTVSRIFLSWINYMYLKFGQKKCKSRYHRDLLKDCADSPDKFWAAVKKLSPTKSPCDQGSAL